MGWDGERRGEVKSVRTGEMNARVMQVLETSEAEETKEEREIKK